MQFAICTQNKDCDDLALLKVYQVLVDENAAKNNYIRVIDESGEDYLYPEACFTPISLPASIEQTLQSLFSNRLNLI